MTVTFQEFPPRKKAGGKAATLVAVGPAYVAQSSQPKGGLYRNLFKRVFDVSAVILAAPFVVPLVFGLALAVRRDGGHAFYTQQRVGKDGRHFRMWKLRSMVTDADARMADYLAAHPEARREWEETQKLKRDPRITAFGQFLRRSSLDELPQLWNVLTGDMSLVGPRPMMLNQQALYPGSAYYRLRPGITGPWQTSGRNDTSFGARAEFDADYDRTLSLGTDLQLLGRTVGVVVKCTGY